MPPKDIAAFSLCSVIAALLSFFCMGPLGLFFAPLLNVTAIVTGAIAQRKMKAAGQPAELAVVGLVLGIIGLVVSLILLVLAIIAAVTIGGHIFSSIATEIL